MLKALFSFSSSVTTAPSLLPMSQQHLSVPPPLLDHPNLILILKRCPAVFNICTFPYSPTTHSPFNHSDTRPALSFLAFPTHLKSCVFKVLCDPIYEIQRQQCPTWPALVVLVGPNCWIICFMSLADVIKAWPEVPADCKKKPEYFVAINLVQGKHNRWTPLLSILTCSMLVPRKD